MHNSIHKDTMIADPNVWHDNRAALGSSGFSNIVAMNGYWNRKDTTFTQVDWVKILTHSIYNNWEAEGRGDFYSDTIKMERNTALTTEVFDNSIVSIKTRSIEDSSYYTEQDQFVIRGPYVYQDCIYKVESRMGNDTIAYMAKFKLRVGNKPEGSEPVCSVKVWVNYYDNENRFLTKLLASQLVTTAMLSDEEYSLIQLEYKITGLDVYRPQLPFGMSGDEVIINFPYVMYPTSRVYYEVIIPQGINPSSYGELYIDLIEIVDQNIWEENEKFISQRLTKYDDLWSISDSGSVYQNKMKFFYTLDEPHAYDRFHPYRIVESYMNNMSQFNNKFMLTKIYPEWSGEKEGLNVLRTWNNIVKPRKSMFWYYTVFNDNPGTILTHSQLRTRLQEVNEKYEDFYYTAQTFGARKLSSIGNPNPTNADYHYYKTPTGSEALGQSMQALAYGCKGIFYETYYSYKSWYTGWNEYFAEGLVGENLTQYNVPRVNDFGLYDTIKSIGKRLKGTLGKHLLQFQYTNNDACIAYSLGEKTIPYKDTACITEFAIFDINLLRYPEQTNYFNFGFTKFKPKSTSLLTGSYYFLLNINAWEIAEPIAGRFLPSYNKIKFGIKVDNLKNWHFYDIEGGGNYYFRNIAATTGYDFVDSVAIGLGDGRLYRLIPTVGSSGPLLEDETIPTGEILSSEGTITVPMGVTLKIEGNYTLTDSLIIEDGGVLKLEPGSTLNLDSASSVYCAGYIYINGTETNKVTINFLQPNETKQNSIYLGNGSSAIVKYAQIKNGYSGISATMVLIL